MDETEPLKGHEHVFLMVVVGYGVFVVAAFWTLPVLFVLALLSGTGGSGFDSW